MLWCAHGIVVVQACFDHVFVHLCSCESCYMNLHTQFVLICWNLISSVFHFVGSTHWIPSDSSAWNNALTPHSLTYPLTRPLTHTYSLTHSLTYSLIHSLSQVRVHHPQGAHTDDDGAWAGSDHKWKSILNKVHELVLSECETTTNRLRWARLEIIIDENHGCQRDGVACLLWLTTNLSFAALCELYDDKALYQGFKLT